MQLEIIRTLPQWLALGEEWNELLARSVVRVPFLRHEFLNAWWTRLGGCDEWPHGELYVVLAQGWPASGGGGVVRQRRSRGLSGARTDRQ